MLAWMGGSRRKMLLAKRNANHKSAIENRIKSATIKRHPAKKSSPREVEKKRGREEEHVRVSRPVKKFKATPLNDEMSLDVATIQFTLSRESRLSKKANEQGDSMSDGQQVDEKASSDTF